MIIDFRTARRCVRQLCDCRSKIINIIEQTTKVRNRLIIADCDSNDIIITALTQKIKELREERDTMTKMIASLDRIIEIYQKTEQKNITKSRIIPRRRSSICRTDLYRFIPRDLLNLIRFG